MYFTVIILNAPEGPSLTYDLVFHPTPTWLQGHKLIYSVGDLNPMGFKNLLNIISQDYIERLDGHKIVSKFNSQKKVKIICHEGGHGSEVDLDNLTKEIKDEGFDFIIIKS